MKICTKCKELKSLDFFHKNKSNKDGLACYCNSCFSDWSILYYQKNKERRRKYLDENKEKISKKKRKWQEKNKERVQSYEDIKKKLRKEKSDIRKKLNKEKQKISKQDWHRQRKKESPLFKLRCNISSRTSASFRYKGIRKAIKTEDMLGCSFQFMRDHLVRQFTEGMTLDNYGEWHIDHIKPLSSAKNKKELIKLAHYTNLQPLWAIDNLKKGSK